jgi:hypothetical protein
MNVLVLYHSTQTFTNTVFEHINAFTRFSRHRYFFCHHDPQDSFLVDLSKFDAVVIHYCLRMPYDQVSPAAAERLAAYTGAKVLFMQDEYENTHRAWHWIHRLGIHLVFTVVPKEHVADIYPPAKFPGVRFVSNLTGYVPEGLSGDNQLRPPSGRALLVAYRGRPLPIRYGQLGREKVEIGRLVRDYCERRGLPCDIAWSEEARIYGDRWYPFIASCRSMLGSESGSNVFDWDFTLQDRIEAYRLRNPGCDDEQVYQDVVEPLEMPGVMNQVSPRVFEAIAFRTVLVLFEGSYSGVVEPWKHYIPLRKDGSNLDEVFARLHDGAFVDAMAQRAWDDVIGSGRYSYPRWVAMTDAEIEAVASSTGGARLPLQGMQQGFTQLTAVTTLPIRWPPPSQVVPDAVDEAGSVLPVDPAPIDEPLSRWNRMRQASLLVWSCVPEPVRVVLRRSCVPEPVRVVLRPVINGVLRPLARAVHSLHRSRLRRGQAQSGQ